MVFAEIKYFWKKIEGVCQPWNVSSMAQAAGLAALQEREYVEKGRQVTFQELAYLKEELAALGYPVYPSQANYVIFYRSGGFV